MTSALSPRVKQVILAVIAVVVIGVICAVLIVGIQAVQSPQVRPYPVRPPILPPHPKKSAYGAFRFGAVSTDTKVCSQIGTEIMALKGGSAVDSAIATVLCVGIVNPHSNGIGGGHFMTVYSKLRNGTGPIFKSIDAREVAPAAATQNMYVNGTASSSIGAKAVAVLGEIRGLHKAWEMFGKLKWSDLIQPAIKLCMDGFPVERELSEIIKLKGDFIKRKPEWSAVFMRNGKFLKKGDILYRKKLGKTFERIAKNPLDMYTGALANDIAKDLSDQGGIITSTDLNNYQVIVKDPLTFNLKNGNYTIYTPRPPAGGAIFAFIMNILDGYNFTKESINKQNKVLTYHRIIEAEKFAFGKRSNMADEDFIDEVKELAANLTSNSYGESIRKKITDNSTQNLAYYEPTFDIVPDGGTAHMSILAPDGSAVAITSTINLYFGSQVMGKKTGIIFNNEMDDFSTPGTRNAFNIYASPANFIKPGKRPLSSMSPTIIADSKGNVAEIVGASGGPTIITASVFTAISSLWFKQRIDQAVDVPRFHHQLLPPHIYTEIDFPKEMKAALQAKGHKTQTMNKIGRVQAIYNNCLNVCGRKYCQGKMCVQATADRRKGGVPDGF